MGNLGACQLFATAAKKVGGPVALAAYTAIGGWALLRGAEFGAKAAAKFAKSQSKPGDDFLPDADRLFTVHTDSEASNQLKFRIGDQFRVLERDKEAVLIVLSKVADAHYFVSSITLARLSDFPADNVHVGE